MKQFTKMMMVLAAFAGFTGAANAAVDYTAGHGGVGVAYEAGAWDLHFHAEGATIDGVPDTDGEYEPDDITIVVPASTAAARPAGAAWDFLGVASGEAYWTLPQGNVEGLPFLGLEAEELDTGVFVNDSIDLAMSNVSGPAGGEFSVYRTDSFGQPTVLMSTFDSAGDTIALAAGAHRHVAWAFTAPGTYEVTFEASGILDDGLGTFTSGQATYTFQVVPEPASLLLLGLGAVVVCRTRKGR